MTVQRVIGAQPIFENFLRRGAEFTMIEADDLDLLANSERRFVEALHTILRVGLA